MVHSGGDNAEETWILKRIQSFAEVTDTIDQIMSHSNGPCLLSSKFLSPIVDNLNTEEALYAATLQSSRPHVLAIMTHRRNRPGVWTTYQPPQAPLGLFWAERGFDWMSFIPGLFRELPGFAVLISILHQERPALADELRTRAEIVFHMTTGSIRVHKDFESYWNERPAKYRRNISNRYNRLKRDGITTRLEWLRDPGEMDKAVNDFGLMESAGWKGRENTAVHPDNVQGRVYRAVMRDFAESGEAIAFRYFVGDQLACTDLALLSHRELVFLKTTYDEGFSQYSPSQLMRKEIFERIFDEQLADRIEFYGRVQDRHRAVCTDFRDIGHIDFYRWPALKKLRQLNIRQIGHAAEGGG